MRLYYLSTCEYMLNFHGLQPVSQWKTKQKPKLMHDFEIRLAKMMPMKQPKWGNKKNAFQNNTDTTQNTNKVIRTAGKSEEFRWQD